MNYIQLGKTDLIVSRICFGCWQLSPRFWGDVPLEQWRDAMSAALDVGVNFVDTADAYGDGFAESALGDWLAEKRSQSRRPTMTATRAMQQRARTTDLGT